MLRYVIAVACCAILAVGILSVFQRDKKVDIQAAKGISITCLGKSRTIGECLEGFSGKDGGVAWDSRKITSSHNGNLRSVVATLVGKDSKGEVHTCSVRFRINHTTGTYEIEGVYLDFRMVAAEEGVRLLFFGFG